MNTEKEKKVYGIFQNIAENYDAANDRMSLGMQKGWKQHLIDAVFEDLMLKANTPKPTEEIQEEYRVLDICCGTGDIAIAIKERAEKENLNVKVYGLDFSPAMLGIAKGRCEKAPSGSPLKEIEWIEGSALELPFEENSFDAVTISFGLRNTPDFRAVLAEMRRVTKPSAKLFVLDSFELKKGIIYPFYKFYFGILIPFFENKYKEEYKWLNRSTELFLSPEELSCLMTELGLSQLSVSKYLFGACCLLSGRK